MHSTITLYDNRHNACCLLSTRQYIYIGVSKQRHNLYLAPNILIGVVNSFRRQNEIPLLGIKPQAIRNIYHIHMVKIWMFIQLKFLLDCCLADCSWTDRRLIWSLTACCQTSAYLRLLAMAFTRSSGSDYGYTLFSISVGKKRTKIV